MNNPKQRASRKRAAAAAATSWDRSVLVDEPSAVDVVFGRGSAQSWRPGNVYFHDLLDQITPRYQSARTKKAKRAIVQEIFNHITARHGRFLEYNEEKDQYVEVDEDVASSKIGDAIRYRKKRIIKAEAQKLSAETLQSPVPDEANESFQKAFRANLVSQQEPTPGAAVPAPIQSDLLYQTSTASSTPSLNAAAAVVSNSASDTKSSDMALFSDEDLESILDDIPTPKHPPPSQS